MEDSHPVRRTLTPEHKKRIERKAKALFKANSAISDDDLRFELTKFGMEENLAHDEDWIKYCIDKVKFPDQYKRMPQGYGFS